MSGSDRDLARRFVDHVGRRGWLDGDPVVVVACSGGLDSTVLLHLLRFVGPPVRAVVAHFDHALRPDSVADARWVSGLARAWDLSFECARAPEPPSSEDEAREARYGFLRAVGERRGARWIVTAHHADDQAETVLFRVLRGTGLDGLAGIAEADRGLLRPLLPFRREALASYAAARRMPWRNDRTNRDTRHARNVLRREILPRVRDGVASGATGALVRLASLAGEERRYWERRVPTLMDAVVAESGAGHVTLVRGAFLDLDEVERARLLRDLLRRFDVVLDHASTRAALDFLATAPSGSVRDLPRAVVLGRDFDRLFVRTGRRVPRAGPGARPDAQDHAAAIEIRGDDAGERTLTLHGRTWRVRWAPSAGAAPGLQESFATEGTPLWVRSWRAGDRIRLAYGTKKLAKVFAEARVPLSERRRRPLVTTASDRVVWVPGLARSTVAVAAEGAARVWITVTEVDPG